MVVPVHEAAVGFRTSEKVLLFFFTYATAASFVFPLLLPERFLILSINILVGAAVWTLGKTCEARTSRVLLNVRDWLPAVLILLAYRESGLFLAPDPTHHLDYIFIKWDRAILSDPVILQVISACSPWLQRYLEFAYLLCYPLVPLGAGALLLLRRNDEPTVSENRIKPTLTRARYYTELDHFWTAVLLAALACYFLFPFFPLTPPRELFHDVPGPAIDPLLRKWNFWILEKFSVHACIFPSGHVAATTAVALVIRKYLPRLGVGFVIAAVSIAISTVYGRYHYAADAVTGALVGLIACWAANRLFRN